MKCRIRGNKTKNDKNVIEQKNEDDEIVLVEKVHEMRRKSCWVGHIEITIEDFQLQSKETRNIIWNIWTEGR